MSYFFRWLNLNWQAVCGWSTALYLTFRIGKFFTAIILKISSVASRFELAESTLTAVATNHLPHMQLELEKNNTIMTSMNETLKKIYAYQVGDDE